MFTDNMLAALAAPVPALRQASPATVRRRKIADRVRRAYPELPNPWGVSARSAYLLDLYLLRGDSRAVAAELGMSHRSIEGARCEAWKRIPGPHHIAKLLVWYEFRKEALGLQIKVTP